MTDPTTDCVQEQKKEPFLSRAKTRASRFFLHDMPSFYEKNRHYILSFLLPLAILLLIYAVLDIYPFGKRSILILDLNAQYIYFFEELRDIILGKGNLLYTFERTMSGEFMGIFAYYLSSPLSFIVALFPEDGMTEAIMFLMLAKCSLSGGFFSIYLTKTSKIKKPLTVVMFSTLYALTAYAVVMQNNLMWMDNYALLPLICLGVEKLIKEGKYKLYVISLALAIFSNFYIGYMTCIFVFFYFFMRFFSFTKEERNPLGEKAHTVKTFGRIALFSVIAVMMAFYVIITAYYSLSFGKNDFSKPDFSFEQRFDFLELFARFLFGSYDTVRPEGLPTVYCGMLTLLLVPIYFICKNVKTREKVAYFSLCALLIACFNINTLDMVWHGFQAPNWLNYRYSYMLCFLLIVMAYRAFDEFETINFNALLGIGGVLAAVIMIVQHTVELEKHSADEKMPDFQVIWASLLIIAVYIILLAILRRTKLKETFSLILLLAVGVEAFVAGLLNWADLINDVGWAPRYAYRDFNDHWTPAAEYLSECDPSFYRAEKTEQRKVNDNFAVNLRGLSGSTSTLNESVIDFLKQLGMCSKSHWTKYAGATPPANALLNVKYLLNQQDMHIEDIYVKVFDENNPTDIDILENPYVLPLAFCVDESARKFAFAPGMTSPFQRINSLYGRLTGDAYTRLFVGEDVKVKNLVNCHKDKNYVTSDVYRRDDDSLPVSFVYEVTAKTTGEIYYYFPSDYHSDTTIYIKTKDDTDFREYGTFFENETYCIALLGSFEAGEKVEVKLEFESNSLHISNAFPCFVYLDEELFAESIDKLRQGGLTLTKANDRHLEGTINVGEDQIVFTSIPYDEGWNVTVDGEPVEIFKMVGTVLAFETAPGEHTVVMKYFPKCAKIGILVTVLGDLAFIGFVVLDYLHKKKYPPVAPVCEAVTADNAEGSAEQTAETSEAEKALPDTETGGKVKKGKN